MLLAGRRVAKCVAVSALHRCHHRSKLTNHPEVDFIILTGGTDTGLAILKQRPDIFLAAETGGKNATIVTAMSDRDQAISNVIYSAFGNCGQKCSATSLLILEGRYMRTSISSDNWWMPPKASHRIGMGFLPKMGPLIRPPQGDLKKALSDLQTR